MAAREGQQIELLTYALVKLNQPLTELKNGIFASDSSGWSSVTIKRMLGLLACGVSVGVGEGECGVGLVVGRSVLVGDSAIEVGVG